MASVENTANVCRVVGIGLPTDMCAAIAAITGGGDGKQGVPRQAVSRVAVTPRARV